MNKASTEIYRSAFDLKRNGQFKEAIAEFNRISDSGKDKAHMSDLMIAMLYLHEIEDRGKALPFAKRAIKMKPKSEMASVCLVHCLFDSEFQDEIEGEIQRYISSGGKIDEYKKLLKENGLTIENFT